MTNSIRTRYEDYAYAFGLHPQVNVDHIHAVARILGYNAARPETARVLEIGCGAGPDLLTMAERFPDASFLGMDFAQSAIDSGNQIAREANLTNIKLVQGDLMDWSPPDEKFDYIIAHGFFSWVPDEVKERLLEVCSAALSETGVAYISYLTYPGCKQDEALRDFILMRTEGIQSLDERVAQTRNELRFLERGWSALKAFPAASYFKQRSQMILKKNTDFVVHDDLGEVRDPCYLVQFVEWANEHGLSYLGDSELFSILLENLPQTVASELASKGMSQLETEQTMDFITNRTFRSSLVVKNHSGQSQRLSACALKELSLSCRFKESTKKKKNGVVFSAPECGKVTISNTLVIEILRTMIRAQHSYTPYPELLATYQKKSGRTLNPEEIEQLDQTLLAIYSRNGLKALTNPVRTLEAIPNKPNISSLNRIYLRKFGFLAAPDMHSLPIPEELRNVFLLLDGTRTVDELASSPGGKKLGKKLNHELLILSRTGILT